MSFMLSALLSMSPIFAANATATSMPSGIYYDANIEFHSKPSGLSLYGCKTEEIEIDGLDPVLKSPRKISITFYKSITPGSKKAVILIPPTGGVNIIDKGYANKLCGSGISVALVEGWNHQLETSIDFSIHDKGALRYVSAIKHTVEFLYHKNLNSIGLLGTSIGAIGGALVFGLEERISAATFIVGSARFADVVASSDEKGATLLRKKRMKLYSLSTIEQYQDLLRNHITLEPSLYLKSNANRSTLVITADDDKTVPSEYQNELAQLLNSKVISLQGNHLAAIKQAYWSKSATIVGFFNNSL